MPKSVTKINLLAFFWKAILIFLESIKVIFLNCSSVYSFVVFLSKMSAISLLNPKAEFAKAQQALSINISAAKGLHDVMKTNLGPKGTLKM